MTYARTVIAPSPHLLDPAQTRVSAQSYAKRFYPTKALLEQAIADHQRALEHEQAILDGYRDALERR